MRDFQNFFKPGDFWPESGRNDREVAAEQANKLLREEIENLDSCYELEHGGSMLFPTPRRRDFGNAVKEFKLIDIQQIKETK